MVSTISLGTLGLSGEAVTQIQPPSFRHLMGLIDA